MVRIFRVFIPVSIIILLVSEVALTLGAFVAGAFFQPDPATYLRYGNGVLNISVVAVTIILGMYLNDLYTEIYVKSHIELLQQLSFVLGVAFLIQGGVNYVDSDLRMPLHVMVPGSAIAVIAIYIWRLLFSSVVLKAMGGDRLLLVGNSPLLKDIVDHLHAFPEKGLSVLGVVSNDAGATDEQGKFLGRVDSLTEIAAATHPGRIVVGMRERRNRLPVKELLDLRYKGYLIEEAATTFERVCGRICIKELRPSQLIYAGEFSRRPRAVFYQNARNLILASICTVAALPLMLLTALAVRLSSPGPILYRQKRVGMDGAPFTVYKFRSMTANAEAQTGAVWAQRNDPRVTGVGRVIRKIRFDELPQLFNVLKGEMSIVGPRPERPEFVESLSEQIPYYPHRHAVKPGITGWAQINYKYGDTIEDTIMKLEYDLYYIKHMSFSLDLYIMFHTLKTMLVSRGAQ